jgi:hypothetical protein
MNIMLVSCLSKLCMCGLVPASGSGRKCISSFCFPFSFPFQRADITPEQSKKMTLFMRHTKVADTKSLPDSARTQTYHPRSITALTSPPLPPDPSSSSPRPLQSVPDSPSTTALAACKTP